MKDLKKALISEAETALEQLARASLSVGGRRRLLHYVIRNHPEAGGHDATEERFVKDIYEQNLANVRAAVKTFADAIEPSRVDEAAARLRDLMAVAVPMLESASFDTLERELVKFGFVRNTLSRPIPPPSPADEARRTALAGWTSQEGDFLAADLLEGETPLRSFDAREATTATGRVISRQELRDKNRPLAWTRIDTWQEQFPEITEDA